MSVPLRIAARLRGHRGAVLLHSGRNDDDCGRWSFGSCEPVRAMAVQGRGITIYDRTGAVSETLDGNPLDILEALVREHSSGWTETVAGPVPVAMGYLGYDLGRVIEPYRQGGGARAPGDVPDARFGLYDAVWRFDGKTGKSDIVGRDAGCKRALAEAIGRGDDELGRPPRLGPLRAEDAPSPTPVPEHVAVANYLERVRRILDYIRAGDVYQVNLARRLVADVEDIVHDPVALYSALARHAPAPYGAYLAIPGADGMSTAAYLLSGSPERFLYRATGSSRLETRPIKGTRRRTGHAERDRALAEELAGDPKERAEHLMIVDLERNDLGRVAETGSVAVDSLGYVVPLPGLLHMVSRVSCQLRPRVGLADILRATFPGGSITGAPKIRAMEIIDELEPTRRGPYTGAIGYIGLGNAIDLSIAIRTALLTPERLVLHVGGGVVADSTPERELEETEEKAAGWRAAVKSYATS